MENIVIIVVVAAIIGAACWYIHKEKKRGVKCIGCPEGCSCSSQGGCSGCAGCGSNGQA